MRTHPVQQIQPRDKQQVPQIAADDFLRKRKLPLWSKNSREALFVRRLARKENVSYETYETYLETRSPNVVANILICLIHQTNYLLDQLIRKLEKDFLAEGGLRERMTRARLAHRAKQKRSRYS